MRVGHCGFLCSLIGWQAIRGAMLTTTGGGVGILVSRRVWSTSTSSPMLMEAMASLSTSTSFELRQKSAGELIQSLTN